MRTEQNNKFDQMSNKFDDQSSKLEQIQQHVSHQVAELKNDVTELDVKVVAVECKVNEQAKKLQELEARIEGNSSNVISNDTTSVHYATMGYSKPPTFDGEYSFETFRTQFNAAVQNNKWNKNQQANELILALRGKASDVLQSCTEKSFECIMKELETRFGQSHRQELCKIQLTNRKQQRGEDLQSLGLDVIKLARQAYCDVPSNVLDGLTKDAFINALRDDQLKLQLKLLASGKTLNETIVTALQFEAAKSSCNQDIVKLRKLDAEDITQIEQLIEKKFNEKAAASRNRRPRTRNDLICYSCQKPGHFARECTNKINNTTASRMTNKQAPSKIRQVTAQEEEEKDEQHPHNMQQGN